MTPDPDKEYPPGSFFLGNGSPTPASDILPFEKTIDVFYSGQGGHERREQLRIGLQRIPATFKRFVRHTGGFSQGLDPEQYLARMASAWFAPAPSGPCTQDSFRFYEALEADAIPIADAIRPLGAGCGYWEKIGLGGVAPQLRNWNELGSVIGSMHASRFEAAAGVSSRWQQYKRRVAWQLRDDVTDCSQGWCESGGRADDQITVIIPTSPIPSNPSTEMIRTTIDSVRGYLPAAEILITCDGVRDEQLDRKPAYDEYLFELCRWTNRRHNVCPFVHPTHQHQSGMLRHILPEVRTPYLLYVEADCPLEGGIDFGKILETMDIDDLSSMRFYHEVAPTEGSEHLFFDVRSLDDPSYADYAPTIQWSQRPHLARTDWYEAVIDTYFGEGARTFLEDVMHGVVQHGTPTWKDDLTPEQAYAWRIRAEAVWREWRMGVYAPEGSWKRSGHLDGRADDPKFDMLIAYDGERPEGAPAPGWMDA